MSIVVYQRFQFFSSFCKVAKLSMQQKQQQRKKVGEKKDMKEKRNWLVEQEK